MLSERILFVIERVDDILKLEEEENLPKLELCVKRRIIELQRELLRFHDYLRNIEMKYDDQRVLSDYEQQVYLYLGYSVDSCDYILDNVMSKADDNDDRVALDIDCILEKIRNICNPCITQFKPRLVVGNNWGGCEQVGNTGFINSSQDKQGTRPKSFGHYPNPDLVGFKREIETLLDHLLHSHEKTRVVGIVGMGGLGKTTLAKHIYHHPVINTRFTIKVWVCISQCWDKTSILNSIWTQTTGNPAAQTMGYDQVVDRLYRLLSSTTYLLVLDDIWSIHAWNDIYQALPYNRGSRVVMTTRNKALPKLIDPNVVIVEPKQLNYEESYELFRRRTYLTNNCIPSDSIQLEKEMVKKCKGLPLAINALAGIMKMEKSQSNWPKINKTFLHNILKLGNESTQGVVKEVLALSYYELPLHLKPCVLYLHVFPENYEISARKLIQMWIVECIVDEESVAEECIEEIAQRCLVEVVTTDYRGQVRTFRIHDLFRQMLIDMDRERGLLKDTLRLVPRASTVYGDEKKINDFHTEVLLSYLHRSSLARSLILLDFEDRCNLKLQPLFIKLRLLRVLILDHILVKELPEDIGNLVHLRYLEFSGSSYHLPGSIGNLVNLRTIDIRNLHTSTFQINLRKLKELRHLYLPKSHDATEGDMEALKLEKLEKLKTLWNAKGGKWMVLGMPNLSATLQELCVLDIKSEEQLMAVFETPSIISKNLHTLVLMWNCSPVELSDMSILSKCRSLITLKLRGRIGVSKPIAFPPNLVKLEMAYTHMQGRDVMNIISESCPLLRILALRDNAYMGTELVSNANSFPQLAKLTFELLRNLKLWIIEESAMPRLHHLTIKGCKNMNLNHEGWTLISKIPVLKCEDLSPTFEERMNLNLKSLDSGHSKGKPNVFHCVFLIIPIIALLMPKLFTPKSFQYGFLIPPIIAISPIIAMLYKIYFTMWNPNFDKFS